VEVGTRYPLEYKLKVANKWALYGVEKILRFRVGFCKYNMGLLQGYVYMLTSFL
jgi:hypothetical protein